MVIQERVNSFSDEARRILQSEGYWIYTLTGKSINSLRAQGLRFSSPWHRTESAFESHESRKIQVAFCPNPSKFYLEGTMDRGFDEQQRLINQFAENLRIRCRRQDIDVVIGEVFDYIELVHQHLERTNGLQRLFGREYGFGLTKTKTETSMKTIAAVGNFTDAGLAVESILKGRKSHRQTGLVPLVVSLAA